MALQPDGATQLIMPLVFGIIRDISAVKFTAWRIAFFIPAMFQTLAAFSILIFGQDMPDGNFYGLQKSGEKPKDKFSWVFYYGVTNYRGWILALTYGYCFGVELTVDNIIAGYFFYRFNLKIQTAGMIAASFGPANLFSRPAGGFLLDLMAKRFGMKGRIWALWVEQTLELGGMFCEILGQVDSLSASIVVMIAVSVFVQAACGHSGSLGVVSGMTGGGGNVGAVLTQLMFFRGSRYSKETGITLMGVIIICCTLPLCLIHFPQRGGMFCGPSTKMHATEEE